MLAAGVPLVVGRVIATILLAFATTAISLRLLGIRRGWGRALLSGTLGWSIAIFVALGLSHWEWGADGLRPLGRGVATSRWK